MAEISFGEGAKARTYEVRLTMRGVRIAEAKVGKRSLFSLLQLGADLPLGDAMEIVAAGMLPTVPNASVALVEGLLEKQPEKTMDVLRVALEAIVEFYKRISPKKVEDDEGPTEPQSDLNP